MVLFDEIEDAYPLGAGEERRISKAWMNGTLERNPIGSKFCVWYHRAQFPLLARVFGALAYWNSSCERLRRLGADFRGKFPELRMSALNAA